MSHYNTTPSKTLFPQLAQQLVNDILILQQTSHNEIAQRCKINHEIILQVSQGDFSELSDDSFAQLLGLYQTFFPQTLIYPEVLGH